MAHIETILPTSYSVAPDAEPPAPSIDPLRLLRMLRGGIGYIAAGLIAGIVLGLVALAFLPPHYTSSTSLLIDPKRPGTYGAEAEFANLYVDEAKIASVEQILISADLLGKVVQTQNLAADPEFGDAHQSIVRSMLARLTGKTLTPPLNTAAARQARAVDHLSRMMRTGRVGVTYVIKIDVTAHSALQAQQLAAAIADTYIGDQLSIKSEAARHDSNWLSARVAEQHKELMASEETVEAIRQKYGLTQTDSGPGSTIDRQAMTELNQQLTAARGDEAAAAAKYQQVLHVVKTGGNLEGLPDVENSHVIDDLRKQQADAERTAADLSTRYGANYPALRQAQQVRRSLRSQVSAEVSRVVDSLRNEYQAASAHRADLESQLGLIVGHVSAAANARGRVQLREAEGIAEANRAAYESSLGRLKDVEQQQTRQEAEARIISQPVLEDSPSFPKPTIFLPAGAAFGLLAGTALAFLRAPKRERIDDAQFAERNLSLPVLAMMPYLRTTDLQSGPHRLSIPDYLRSEPYSAFAESLKLLRLRLLGGGRPQIGRIVQFTSALAGEGKSTIAISTAMSAAAAGMRTVVLDLDFHRPTIGKLMGSQYGEAPPQMTAAPAATRHLALASDVAPRPTVALRVIEAGSVSHVRYDALEGAELHDYIRTLAQEFDLVVLDTPPVLLVSDPLFIARMADSLVLVVAWRATSREQVQGALTALRAAGAPLAGMVLNKVRAKNSASYGEGYYSYTSV